MLSTHFHLMYKWLIGKRAYRMPLLLLREHGQIFFLGLLGIVFFFNWRLKDLLKGLTVAARESLVWTQELLSVVQRLTWTPHNTHNLTDIKMWNSKHGLKFTKINIIMYLNCPDNLLLKLGFHNVHIWSLRGWVLMNSSPKDVTFAEFPVL